MRLARFVLVAAAVAAVTVPLTAGTIDYGSRTGGEDIEGVLLGHVVITSPAGGVTYIVDGGADKAYGAPNVAGFPSNGCLPAEGGFADLQTMSAQGRHVYVLTFWDEGAPATIEDFSITMFDFGDFNPYQRTHHLVEVRSYDAAGDPLDSDVLEIYTTGAVNPRSGSSDPPPPYTFDPWFASDACTADAGEPGAHTFSVASPGIASIQIEVVTASDPNIGFAGASFTLEEPCTSHEVELCAGQHDPIGEVVVSNDADNLYVTFSIDEPGWYLDDTHVAVANAPDALPQTRKGNPIPGQFPYECELVDPMTTTCTVAIALGEWCDGDELYVAAHAAVVQVEGDGCDEEVFWAESVVGWDQGTLKDGDPVLPERSDPTAVFDLGGDFFSLGFDLLDDGLTEGWLTVGFGAPVFDGPGADVVVQEVTNGRDSYPLEEARVFGSDDGMLYFGGTVGNRDGGTGWGTVELPDVMAAYEAVTIVDATDPSLHTANADGFDVDAIGACYLLIGEETAWGDGCDGHRFTDRGNWGTHFTYTVDGCAGCPTD